MKTISIYNQQGLVCNSLELNVQLKSFNEPLVHQVVDAFLKNAKQNTRAQKTRSDVTATGKKPWKQKGMGRARSGQSSSPLWRGGGLTFPNKPHDNSSQKINKKMYRGAMASIISNIIEGDRIKLVDNLNLEDRKTKIFCEIIDNFKLCNLDLLLIIHPDETTDNFYYASRNVRKVLVINSDEVNPYLLLRYRHILSTKQAFKFHMLSHLKGFCNEE